MKPLVVGISTRALFALEEEHAVFESEGVYAYAKLQREREAVLIPKGTGFGVVERLLSLNANQPNPLVEVVLLSKNTPDLSLRAFRSIEHYGLQIEKGSFTGGRPVAPYVVPWGIDLFLSNDEGDVQSAVAAGTAAAKLGTPPTGRLDIHADEVRFAFDGDAVLFSAESDQIFVTQGLDAFLAHERENAEVPMKRGPFGNLLVSLAALWRHFERSDGTSRVRIALVTARTAPAHERVVHTFRAWGTPVDEAHFVGRNQKANILRAFGADIFFDDQQAHVLGAAPHVPAGLVPGPHLPDKPVLPAER